jgi:hypothetical protein
MEFRATESAADVEAQRMTSSAALNAFQSDTDTNEGLRMTASAIATALAAVPARTELTAQTAAEAANEEAEAEAVRMVSAVFGLCHSLGCRWQGGGATGGGR